MTALVNMLAEQGSGAPWGGDWHFGFVSEYNNYVKFALFAAMALLVYLAGRSYRREGDAPRRAKATLAGIRITIIVLVFLMAFQPAIVLRYSKTLYNTVVLLVDDSLSMSFKDAYSDPNVQPPRDELARRLDVAPDDVENLSRSQIVQKAFAGSAGLVERLAKDHPLMVLHYSTTQPGKEPYTRLLGTLDAVDGGSSRAAGAGPQDDPNAWPVARRLQALLGQLTSDGYATNPAVAIREALERTQGQRVAAIVHVGDDQATAAGAYARLAGAKEYAAQRGVPIFSVGVGDPTPRRYATVTALGAPPEVRRGSHVEFAATLAYRHLAGQSVTVSLQVRSANDSKWIDTGVSSLVQLDDAGAEGSAGASKGLKTVTLSLEPAELGEYVYRAVVTPSFGSGDDAAAEAMVSVADEKIRVLLIGGDAGWEFQYLRNFFIRQADLYRLSVWQENADPELNQSSSTGMKLTQLPRKLEEMVGVPGDPNRPGYNVVILCDVQYTEGGFDKPFAQDVLAPFVRQHGGGLCFIAGSKYAESLLLGGDVFASLGDLLPVTLAPNTFNDLARIGEARPQPWPLKLTSYGVDHPIMRLDPGVEESQAAWASLPGVFWSHPVAKAKPAARVLAVSSDPMQRTERGEPLPTVAVEPVGKGRSVYVGFNDSWRWRLVNDGYYYRRFWANVVRYLATLRAHQVVITAGGDSFTVGEPVTVEVEAYDERFSPLAQDTFDVDMVDTATGQSQKLTLPAVEGKDKEKTGRFRLTVPAPRKGTFELTALQCDPLAAQKVAGKRLVIDLPKAEALRPEADEAGLKAIASRSEYALRITEIGRLADLIDNGRMQSVDEVPIVLWDVDLARLASASHLAPSLGDRAMTVLRSINLTMLLIVALLAAEWILRKKYNMA